MGLDWHNRYTEFMTSNPTKEALALDSTSLHTSTTNRVARVLLVFGGEQATLGVSEIARRVQLSKSVVHRILQGLVETHLISYIPAGHKYQLGPAALALGHRALNQSELRNVGMPIISRLTEDSGETTTLSARIGYHRVYLGQVESTHPIRITIIPGQQVPLSIGSSSMCILAHLSEEEINWVLSRPIPAWTEHTTRSPDIVRERLRKVRERGYMMTESERVPESLGIASPVFDVLGDVVGAVSIACLASRCANEQQERRLANLTIAAAKDITTALQIRQRGE